MGISSRPAFPRSGHAPCMHSESGLRQAQMAAALEGMTPKTFDRIKRGYYAKHRADGKYHFHRARTALSGHGIVTTRQAQKILGRAHEIQWQASAFEHLWGLKESKTGKILKVAGMTFSRANRRNRPLKGTGYEWVQVSVEKYGACV